MGRVRFNLKNVHYAPITESGYGTIKPITGAVSLSINATGDSYDFWADGIKYFSDFNNTGYEGSLEIADITDDFRKDILGDIEDTKHVLLENVNAVAKPFALGFEVGGNEGSTYFWFYNCTASRPSTEANTSEEAKEVDTDTLDWTCSANENGIVRARTTSTTAKADIDAWFTKVYEPAQTNG